MKHSARVLKPSTAIGCGTKVHAFIAQRIKKEKQRVPGCRWTETEHCVYLQSSMRVISLGHQAISSKGLMGHVGQLYYNGNNPNNVSTFYNVLQ